MRGGGARAEGEAFLIPRLKDGGPCPPAERLLWPAQKEEGAEEEEEGRRAPNGPRLASVPPERPAMRSAAARG